MNYFEELMESFKKLRKRQLRINLKEQLADPEAVARQEVNNAVSMDASFTNPYIPNTAKTPVAIIVVRKTGIVKFMNLNAAGQPEPSTSRPVQEFWNEFVGYFDPDQQEGEEGQEGLLDPLEGGVGPDGQPLMGEGALAGDIIRMSSYGINFGDEVIEAIEAFTEIEANIPLLFNAIPEEYVQETPYSTIKSFRNYVIGAKPQSLEKQHSLASKIMVDTEGKLMPIKGTVDLLTFNTVADNLKKIFIALAKTNATEDDKRFLKSVVGLNSDGTVSVFSFSSDSKEGLVYKDGSGFLKNLLKSAEERFDIQLDRINVKKDESISADNAFRGVSLEEILPLLSMQKKCLEAKKAGNPNADVYCKGARELFGHFQESMTRLIEVNREWATHEELGAIDIDSKGIVDALVNLFGTNEIKNTLANITAISKDAISIRNPDFIIPTGKDTGYGRRTDTVEVWRDEAAAIQAMIRMGYSSEEASEMISPVTAFEAFADRLDLFQIASKAEGIKKSDVVFVNETSLKNYIELKEAQFGQIFIGSLHKNLTGEVAPEEQESWAKFRETITTHTRFTDDDWKAVKEYDDHLFGLGGKIRKIPVKARIKLSSTKKNVQTNPFSNFVSEMLTHLRNASSYKELYQAGAKRELLSVLERYKTKKDDRNMEARAKQAILSYSKNKKIISDLAKGDPVAKKYIITKLFYAGGANSDSLTCDYRSLALKKTVNFKQNDVLRDIANSILHGEGTWDVQAKGNVITFYDKSNPNKVVRMTDASEKKRYPSGHIDFTTKTQVRVNEFVLQDYNKKKGVSVQETLLNSYFANQIMIAEILQSLREKPKAIF